SAKYYAAQAMAGAGLPRYNPGNQPTTNSGDIWINTIGPCRWDAVDNKYYRIPLFNNRQTITASGTFTPDAYTKTLRVTILGGGGGGGT
ncbi:hypothetical protein SB758_36330, partial [Burkholderia sp. SIMBA_013]